MYIVVYNFDLKEFQITLPITMEHNILQAFILPMEKSAVIKEVVVVYYNWLKVSKRGFLMVGMLRDNSCSKVS